MHVLIPFQGDIIHAFRRKNYRCFIQSFIKRIKIDNNRFAKEQMIKSKEIALLKNKEIIEKEIHELQKKQLELEAIAKRNALKGKR